MNQIETGLRIRELREQRKMTQAQLSEITDISINALSNIEVGKNSPSVKTLEAIADTLLVSIDYLIKGIKVPKGNRCISRITSKLECLEDGELDYIDKCISLYLEAKK